MKYLVNKNYLNTENVEAVVKALEHHYGERCIERIAECLEEDSFEIELCEPDDFKSETTFVAVIEE